jgi:anaerobic magnesium-protoporphyrin IX monomethyl ester cyclase
MTLLLVNPPLRNITNRHGVGFQLPLGLLMIGGPLVDAGFDVVLCDADALGLSPREVAATAIRRNASIMLLGHSGSTAANPSSLEVVRAVREALPSVVIVYGGVYPTYAAEELLAHCSAIDVIVRGEGEATVEELVSAIDSGRRNFHGINGITWRDANGTVWRNSDRKPVSNLDQYRIAWELVDWNLYKSFGIEGASAGIQLSRGCPRTCTYCGQWSFWKSWRRRSISRFLDDLQLLHDHYSVRTIWIADENWGDEPALLHELLARLAERQLNLAIYCSMCASDVYRDLGRLRLYREAGIRFILMGVESSVAHVLQRIRKDNPHEMVRRVVSALRDHGILSVVNYIYGIQEESHRTMWESLKRILDIDADFINALYFTPHGWTADGRRTNPASIVQLDQKRWCYRNQVIDAGNLSPAALFAWVKFIEAVQHLRPRWFRRMLCHHSLETRRLLRWCFIHTSAVWAAEIYEQWTSIRYRSPGPLASELASVLLPSGQRQSPLRIVHPESVG